MRVKRRDAEEWMKHRQLPPELVERVRRFDQYRWAATRGVDEEDLVQSLPLDLRRDIKRHLCLDLVRQVSCFFLHSCWLLCPFESAVKLLSMSTREWGLLCCCICLFVLNSQIGGSYQQLVLWAPPLFYLWNNFPSYVQFNHSAQEQMLFSDMALEAIQRFCVL